MRSDDIHVYEVRDGTTVLDRFLKKTPAQKRKKELKKAGRKVRLVSLFTRKFVPIEPKELPKGMEYWKGSVPCEIPTEAANQLSKGWQHINDTFYIGSYRHGELCLPNDRDADLSIQPDGDELALCYISFEDKKAYLILGRIDYISIVNDTVEISGTVEDGSFMTVSLEIEGSKRKHEAREVPFEKGWYIMDDGFLLFVGENDFDLLKEQDSDTIAGMFYYVVVYPGIGKGDYVTEKGYLPVMDGEELDDAAFRKFRSVTKEHIEADRAREMADAFSKGRTGRIREMVSIYPGYKRIEAMISKNRRMRR